MVNLLEMEYKLTKVISGGQTGADQAGLYAARNFCIPTGGTCPDGFKTYVGPNADLKKFGLTPLGGYASRTKKNVSDSDGTIRFCTKFNTPGEICTLRAITQFNKPYFDVDLNNVVNFKISDLVEFVINNQISILNIAGNKDDEQFGKHFHATYILLTEFFRELNDKGCL